MHEFEGSPGDEATAARLRRYFETESLESASAARTLLPAPSGARRSAGRVRFAPIGGGLAVVAVIAIALAVLPHRGAAGPGGGTATPSVAADASGVVYRNGVPVEIDGERVYAGAELDGALALGRPFLAAGQIGAITYGCTSSGCAPSNASVLGPVSQPSGLVEQFLLMSGGTAWQRPDGLRYWPGGLAVLRVRAYDAPCPWTSPDICDKALLVEAVVLPAGTPAASTPAATAAASGIPTEIDGERVYRGDEIAARMAEPGAFLATGTLSNVMYDCAVGSCPEGGTWTLVYSGDVNASGIPLLISGGIWRPSTADEWPGGQVVLRVRGYDATCPWKSFCDRALLVEAAIPPR